jgi:hypothetical protein
MIVVGILRLGLERHIRIWRRSSAARPVLEAASAEKY